MVCISKGIEIIHLSLYLKDKKILIIGDLHLGLENSLIDQGILIPKSQFNTIKDNIKKILKESEVKKIIINGDIKHEFSRINKQEWNDVYSLIEFLKEYCDVEIVIGNHDYIMKQMLDSKGYKTSYFVIVNDIIILHGDFIPAEATTKKIVIIGHEHPSVLLREGPKTEKYKCFIKGKWKDKVLIVMPSFNPLSEGTDVLNEKFLSPFLQVSIENFEVFVVGDKIYNFGKIKNLV